MVDRLWAPWRLEYVAGEKKGVCFLCEAAATDDDAGAGLVWRDDRALVVLNRFPYNNGHLLIAPVAHVADLDDLDDQIVLALMRTLAQMKALLTNVLAPDGFNVGLNLGTAAGAGLADHLHIHIVPRWTGDTNYMPVLADTKVVPQALEDLRRKLVAALADGGRVE